LRRLRQLRHGGRATAVSPLGGRVERISVIVPMLNESAHVEAFVEDLAAQDFEGDVKVVVADGGSTDGSREKLAAAAERAGLDVVILDNPARWASPGLNACLRVADGDLIVRLDCHSRYPSDYLRRSAIASEETGAWAVGGLLEPIGRTPTERGVACALESPFGGHNWAPYKVTPTPSPTAALYARRCSSALGPTTSRCPSARSKISTYGY
jgi:glycosyltransferase involved in cell wall biosynthesis